MQDYQIRQIKWLIIFIFVGVFVHATALPLFNNNGPIHFTKFVSAHESEQAQDKDSNPLVKIDDYKMSAANKLSLLNSYNRVEEYDGYIQKALREHPEVDVYEVYAIIMAESQGNPLAYNQRTDARGLGQITPVALKDLNERFGTFYSADRFDPQTNVDMVVKTLWALEYQYGITDPVERVCAYNEGASGAKKYRGQFDDHLYVQKVAYSYRNI